MNISAFAARLVEAHHAHRLLDAGPEPQSLADAYEAQRLIGERLGENVAGWKLAAHPVLGLIAAPIFAGFCIAENGQWPLKRGPGIEIEIALWLGRDLPPGRYSPQAVADAVTGYSAGVEFVAHRLAEPERNLFAFLGGLMANAGYVAADRRQPWTGRTLAGRACRLRIDNAVIYDAPVIPQPLAPLELVAAWLEKAGDALGGFKAGQFVTTGSLCGVIPANAKGKALAEIDGFGSVSFSLT